MNIDQEKIIRSFRGVALISGAIFLLAMFISQVLFRLTSLGPVVENGASLSPINYILTIILVSFLIITSSTPLTVIFAGLLLGGVTANYIEHLFLGPVDDYIYVPFTGDLYCNLADLAIVAGMITGVLMIGFNWLKYKTIFRVTVY